MVQVLAVVVVVGAGVVVVVVGASVVVAAVVVVLFFLPQADRTRTRDSTTSRIARSLVFIWKSS
jgi:membrane associated rhomboid family serine protease